MDCSFLLSGLVGGAAYVLLTLGEPAPAHERAATDTESAAALTIASDD